MTLLNKHLSGAQGVWWWNTVQQTDQKRNWNREVCYSQFLSSGRIKDAPWGATWQGQGRMQTEKGLGAQVFISDHRWGGGIGVLWLWPDWSI